MKTKIWFFYVTIGSWVGVIFIFHGHPFLSPAQSATQSSEKKDPWPGVGVHSYKVRNKHSDLYVAVRNQS